MAIDRKVFSACQKYASSYNYVWFSSDGTLINIGMLFDILKFYLGNANDLIIFDNNNYMGFSFKEYTDCTQLFHDCCWRMTSLSAVIVSGKLLQRAMRIFPVTAKDNYGLWLPMAYFRAIVSESFHAVYFVKENSWRANPMRNDSFWKLSGNTLWQWGEIWYRVIDALPSVFDQEKGYVLQSHDRYTRIFSIRNLISLKATGNLSFSKIRTYSNFLPKVTNTNLFWFYLIGLFVNRHFAAQCKILYRKLIPRKAKQ